MFDTNPPVIGQALVQKLHLSHADYIQEYCKTEGKAYIVRGANRAFSVSKSSRRNRIILLGDESPETIDELINWYTQHNTESCYVEVNPSNFYSGEANEDPPFLAQFLTERGFTQRAFRPVWVRSTKISGLNLPDNITIRRFESHEMDAFIKDLNIADKISNEENARARNDEVRQGEGNKNWRHYIAYVDDIPQATAALFTTGDIGYLAWAYTNSEARRRGLHGYLIAQRIIDAGQQNCTLTFSCTNFNTQSDKNLQRLGFQLAYNYIRFTKEFK